MSSAYLKAGDIISGQEGKVTANINGVVEVMAYVKNIEAIMEKQKSEIRVIGHRGTQHKTTGWSGTGSMNIYYVTDAFRRLMLQYKNTGVDTSFGVTIQNDDPSSRAGKHTTNLFGVNMDSVVLAKLDVDNTELDEDIDFTFDDFDFPDTFATLN